jgi:hypothetical protein
MNAQELANYLFDITDMENSPYHKAATMLIQQQAEIERLIGAEPITHGMLTFCKKCGEQNPYFKKEQ